MKKLFQYMITMLLFTYTPLYSQNSVEYDYNNTIKEDEGELQGFHVKIKIDMDVEAYQRPMRLQIFVSQAETRKWNLLVSNTKIIESMYPADKGGQHNGSTIPDFFIENGLLQMVTDSNNRKSRYSFQYRNNNFVLVNITRIVWDGKNTTSETEIDLLAEMKIEFDRDLESGKILNKRNEPVQFITLPSIEDLKFSDLEQY